MCFIVFMPFTLERVLLAYEATFLVLVEPTVQLDWFGSISSISFWSFIFYAFILANGLIKSVQHLGGNIKQFGNLSIYIKNY